MSDASSGLGVVMLVLFLGASWLVSKKLVKRDRSNEDRRVVQVELTEQGRALNEEAMFFRRVEPRWMGVAADHRWGKERACSLFRERST